MSSHLPIPPEASHGGSISLKTLPPIYLLPTHLTVEELHELEDKLTNLGALFMDDAKEAKIFLGKVERKTRAAFDLRTRGVWTEEIISKVEQPVQKRRRLNRPSHPEVIVISDTESDATDATIGRGPDAHPDVVPITFVKESKFVLTDLQDRVLVVKLDWLDESSRQRRLLPIEPFVVYEGRRIQKPAGERTPKSSPSSVRIQKVNTSPSTTPTGSSLQRENIYANVLGRAKAEAEAKEEKGHPVAHPNRRRFNQKSLPPVHVTAVPTLKRMTTSEFEESDENALPEPPEWVKTKSIYCCLRSTPLNPPNHRFIAELYKIKESRILTLDQIGVRAYSTSIASLAAYPYLLKSPLEVIRLPGCDERIASHFSEYQASAEEESDRYLPTARKLDEDENLQCLKTFYNIWGCGAETARKMYFTHGWKDIDDVVQFGWNTLTRAQQIGVKFYDEFKLPIPRHEVEQIAEITKSHARKARGIQPHQHDTPADIIAVIVGGYRRGKPHCGDIDIILSHRDESTTRNLIVDLVSALEQSGHITHTLTLHTSTTQRGQQPLPYNSAHASHGFDSLDKALCVWQHPHTPPPPADQSAHPNPNPHRRLDIIISPHRTIGAAVLGWSGATTFERDIRRWCKRQRGWKFDSSGVRDRASGLVLDLEAPSQADADEGDTWEDRERRLMVRLGIGWRPPTERCTG